MYINFQSLMLAANDIQVLKSLNQFLIYSNLVKRPLFSSINSNNQISENYNFMFLRSFSLRGEGLDLSTKSLGIVVSALDFYYIDKNFEDIRVKLARNDTLS